MVKGKSIAQIRAERGLVVTAKKALVKKGVANKSFLEQIAPNAKQRELKNSAGLKLIKSIFKNLGDVGNG